MKIISEDIIKIIENTHNNLNSNDLHKNDYIKKLIAIFAYPILSTEKDLDASKVLCSIKQTKNKSEINVLYERIQSSKRKSYIALQNDLKQTPLKDENFKGSDHSISHENNSSPIQRIKYDVLNKIINSSIANKVNKHTEKLFHPVREKRGKSLKENSKYKPLKETKRLKDSTTLDRMKDANNHQRKSRSVSTKHKSQKMKKDEYWNFEFDKL